MYVPCTKGAPPNIGLVVLMSLTLARMGEGERRTSWYARGRYRCANRGSLQAPAGRAGRSGGLRSDLGIESPSLQSSCRWWMDDA